MVRVDGRRSAIDSALKQDQAAYLDARESRNDSAILTDITFYDLKLRDHLDDRKLCLESSFVEMQSWPFQCSQQIEWFIC